MNKFDIFTFCFFKWNIIVLDLKWLFNSSDVENDNYEGKDGKDYDIYGFFFGYFIYM